MVGRGLWNPLRLLSDSPGELSPSLAAQGASRWASGPWDWRWPEAEGSGASAVGMGAANRRNCLHVGSFVSEPEGVVLCRRVQ